MPPRVSVVVPAYNYADYLSACVESLFRQSYRDWECIIVDDGSTDATPDICARLAREDPRVLFLRQKNKGLSAARNAGINIAKGEFLQFLDADDLLETDKLNVQVQWLESHPSCDIVVGNAAFFSEADPSVLKEWSADTALQVRPLATFVEGNACVVHATLVRARVIDSVGLFDETLSAHEDWDFWLRCALAGKRFAVRSAGRDRALVRQHAVNMSSSRERMLKTAMLVRERLLERLPDELKEENIARLSELRWVFGLELIRAGRRAEGWTLYRAGLRLARHKLRILARLLLLVPGMSHVAKLARASTE